MLFNNTTSVLDANETGNPLHDFLYNVVVISYLTTPSLIAVGNVVVLFTIFYHRAFKSRQEYIVFAGVAFVDLMVAIAYILDAVHIILMDHVLEWGPTPWQCSLLPHVVLYLLFYMNSGLILAAMSFDRLLISVWPTWYMGQNARLGWTIVGVFYGHNFLFAIVSYITGYLYLNDEPMLGLYEGDTCYEATNILPWLYSYEMYMFQIGNIGSIVIFGLVVLINYKRTHSSVDASSKVSEAAAKLQKAMTRKMAYSTVATFVFVIVPISILYATEDIIHPVYSNLIWPISHLNPLMNVWLFLIRHPLMKRGFVAALKRQALPMNLNEWNKRHSSQAQATASIKD